MKKNILYEKLQAASIERQVEDAYNDEVAKFFVNDTTTFEYPYGCDGLLDYDPRLKLLIEYKYDEKLHDRTPMSKVLVQVIYYLKKFDVDGESLPSVVLVADKNEAFVIHTNLLQKYLNEDIDWSIAPSEAPDKNPELVFKLVQDGGISPYVYDVDQTFDFKSIAEKINGLANSVDRKVRITERNISKIYDDFIRHVLKKSEKIKTNTLVSIFINAIIDRENCYKHPSKPNVLVCHGENYEMDGKYYDSFFSHFEKDYSPEDKAKFTEISDRLIEDTNRRRNGEFYTPTIFADYAHKMLSKELGEDWKEKYVVWDCCCGTCNLTRDYKFKELYCSTKGQAELDCGSRYNPEATKFVFDFLNDGVQDIFGCNLPEGLINAFKEDKPIVFFMNPPYGTGGTIWNTSKGKENCADTNVKLLMQKAKAGSGQQNLYAQFLYRILLLKKQFNLTNLFIGVYCPSLFLTGGSFKAFRKIFLKDFTLREGIQFKASFFADVADNWSISYTVWKGKESKNKNTFSYKLVDEVEGELKKIEDKIVYNLDGLETAKDWVKDETCKSDIKQAALSSGINIGKHLKSFSTNALSNFVCDCNNVDNSVQSVTILSSCITNHLGSVYITENNFDKCITLFSARRNIVKTWKNWTDEFCVPNENHPKWQEYVNDSLVYSLFESKSNQSSLRQIQVEDKTFDIKNEFFYLSKEEIKDLANEYHFDFTYTDAKTSEERYVYKKLQEVKLSPEAQKVLDKAIELTRKSFKYREMFDSEHPEYQVMTWDAGWYQIKAILKEYMKDDLKEFNELYKALADKMRPMVYELGFLKK